MKNKTNREENKEVKASSLKINRRAILKTLAGAPVLGFFAYELLKKSSFDKHKNTELLRELELDKLSVPDNLKPAVKGDLIRIGIIGFGSRAISLASALGFRHPDNAESIKNGNLDHWLAQEDLNVAITGVCDVFDLNAQRGIEIADSELRTSKASGLTVKRYQNYKEMLADKDIDAVVIATPDHHHAQMSIDAAKAGKHIYCEKSPSISEDKLYELYDTIKNRDVVYQLGHQITKNAVFQQAREMIKKDILGKISLVETTTNRNTASGAWIRHLDANGNPKPGKENQIDWEQWLGDTPKVPFSIDRFYNWTKWFDYDLGMFGQLFTHEYDAVNQLLNIGIPQSAMASGGIYYWKDNREIPDLLHATFEYPHKNLTLMYSACLASSRNRGRIFMGDDASMELGGTLKITADKDSKKYRNQIDKGLINTSAPMLTYSPGSDKIDAVTSATAKYYEERGLSTTYINNQKVDVTYLHIKEWLDCIRGGGTPASNIERAFEEGVTLLMGHKSYIEGRKVEWDPVNRQII